MQATVGHDPAGTIVRAEMRDGYTVSSRIWGAPTGDDAILLLHGLMSHSAWHAPLGTSLAARGMTLVAPDRRGSGENLLARGDAPSGEALLDDVLTHVEHLKRSFSRVHLGGWCLGARVAILALPRCRELIASLVLIAPAIAMTREIVARRTLLLKMAEAVGRAHPELDLENTAVPLMPVTLDASDFTGDPDWRAFIEADPLRTQLITLRLQRILSAQRSAVQDAVRDAKSIPKLLVFAARDSVVDNAAVARMLESWNDATRLTLDAGHAVQLERSEELADGIEKFLVGLR